MLNKLWISLFSKKYRQTIRELGRLSDRDLQDIGISKCDVERIAYEAAMLQDKRKVA